jgi:tetratricopeptide (TPR) repeat protein
MKNLFTAFSTAFIIGSALVLGEYRAVQAEPFTPKTLLASVNVQDYVDAMRSEPQTAEDFYNQGLMLQGSGQFQEAIQRFNQALKLEPDNADLYFSRGLAHADQGSLLLAIHDYSQAIALDPSFMSAYYNRGLAEFALQQPKDAIADFSAAIKMDGHYDLGQLQLARQDYNQASRLNPRIAESFYDKGFIRPLVGGDSSLR